MLKENGYNKQVFKLLSSRVFLQCKIFQVFIFAVLSETEACESAALFLSAVPLIISSSAEALLFLSALLWTNGSPQNTYSSVHVERIHPRVFMILSLTVSVKRSGAQSTFRPGHWPHVLLSVLHDLHDLNVCALWQVWIQVWSYNRA